MLNSPHLCGPDELASPSPQQQCCLQHSDLLPAALQLDLGSFPSAWGPGWGAVFGYTHPPATPIQHSREDQGIRKGLIVESRVVMQREGIGSGMWKGREGGETKGKKNESHLELRGQNFFELPSLPWLETIMMWTNVSHFFFLC